VDENVGITNGCVFSLIDHFSLYSGRIFADEVDTGEGHEHCDK